MGSPERFRPLCAVHLFLERDGKILMARRSNTGYEDGNYSVIAGHIDGDEPATEAMAREALEEAGVRVEPYALEMVHVMHRKEEDERVDFFFRAAKWAGEPRIMEPDKCDSMGWFPLAGLPANTIPYVRAAIGHWRKSEFYGEFGWHGKRGTTAVRKQRL